MHTLVGLIVGEEPMLEAVMRHCYTLDLIKIKTKTSFILGLIRLGIVIEQDYF